MLTSSVWLESRKEGGGSAVEMKVERRKSVRMADFSWAFSCLAGFTAIIWYSQAVICADLVIRIPGDLSQQDGYYRLDYRKGPVLIQLSCVNSGLMPNWFTQQTIKLFRLLGLPTNYF